ncbi:hypothetical protein EMGR_008315 [Emarellia grisea]
MASKSNTILVLGATGPAGICLLRELISSSYHVVVYARNPAKIPNDIASQGLLTVTKGEMNDHESLEKTMSPCSAVLSLLGPSIDHKDIDPSIYAGYYRDAVFPAMRKLGIRRIIAMGTISISHRDDHFTIFQPMVHVFMRFFAKAIYSNMQNVAATFQKAGQGLDWTVFRIARIVVHREDACSPDTERNSWPPLKEAELGYARGLPLHTLYTAMEIPPKFLFILN